jgi:hypothetical protein
MPLMSTMLHFKSHSTLPQTAYYFDANLVIGVGVLDAPMVGVRVGADSNDLVLTPWVRILRHEPEPPEAFKAHGGKLYAIDVVHRDYFKDYLDQQAMPFAQEFKVRTLKHHEEVASGKGFVSGMGENSWENVEARLQARTEFRPIPVRIPPDAKPSSKKKGKRGRGKS